MVFCGIFGSDFFFSFVLFSVFGMHAVFVHFFCGVII